MAATAMSSAEAPHERATDAPTGRTATEQAYSVAHNMIGTAVQFGLALMIAIVMMITTGLFVANVPTSGAFEDAISTTTDIGGAGFIIIGVTLLVVPVVGLIAYFYRSGLGNMVQGGGMGR